VGPVCELACAWRRRKPDGRDAPLRPGNLKIADAKSHDDVPDDLPQSACDLINHRAAGDRSLIQALPGVRFPVPRGENNNPDGAARFAQLVELVGYEATLILVQNYGNDRGLYVPS
jgi:hypothetical protein